jgi:hypothetical protein
MKDNAGNICAGCQTICNFTNEYMWTCECKLGYYGVVTDPYNMIIIILAERRPLLDVDLPQSVPKWPVLRHPHPADSRNLYQFISPPCRAAGAAWVGTPCLRVRGRHSRTFLPQRPSVLRATHKKYINQPKFSQLKYIAAHSWMLCLFPSLTKLNFILMSNIEGVLK